MRLAAALALAACAAAAKPPTGGRRGRSSRKSRRGIEASTPTRRTRAEAWAAIVDRAVESPEGRRLARLALDVRRELPDPWPEAEDVARLEAFLAD